MKPLFIVMLISASIVSYAQQVEIPQKEFTLSLSDETVTLARGENKKIDIRILKSKAYQKGKMKMGLSSSLPNGITLSFDPEKGDAIQARLRSPLFQRHRQERIRSLSMQR